MQSEPRAAGGPICGRWWLLVQIWGRGTVCGGQQPLGCYYMAMGALGAFDHRPSTTGMKKQNSDMLDPKEALRRHVSLRSTHPRSLVAICTSVIFQSTPEERECWELS